MANQDATVTVSMDGTNQTVYRHGEYFHSRGVVAAGWVPISVSTTRYGMTNQQPSTPGHVLLPPWNQVFAYDADGNLTNDCIWGYTWDGENRLTKMDCLVAGPTSQHLTFEYDWRGRRIRKLVQDASTSTIADLRYVYDGWNLVAEINTTTDQLIRSYLYGLDLSGTFQGAGGVGGLLAINDVTNGVHFVAYDGNGNIVALVKATDGTISARYEYGPFGELIRASGPMAKVNPMRWSTKYWDDETDLVYYGYRYYSPSLGRWLSRDPLEEEGGNNLYAFTANDAINRVDYLGKLAGNDEAVLSPMPAVSSIISTGIVYLNFCSDKSSSLDARTVNNLVRGLQNALNYCKNYHHMCKGIDIASRKIRADLPNPPGNNYYDDKDVVSALRSCSNGPGINVIVTMLPMGINVVGRGVNDPMGILVDHNSLSGVGFAHEVGHAIGYSEGDVNFPGHPGAHNSGPANLMNKVQQQLAFPDKSWCERLSKIAVSPL